MTNDNYASIRIHGMMPHGPDRDINDHVFNVEFNDIHDYGLGIISSFLTDFYDIYKK